MTSTQTGDKWFGELFAGHPIRFHDTFRMSQRIFIDLLQTLVQNHELAGSRRTCAREVLAITLFILSQNETMRAASERFQHSTETICRYFFIGIKSLVRLSKEIIKPIDMQFRDAQSHIRRDERYMPYFKDCIGAIDGTHVDARVPVEDQVAYIGRHGTTTQNVMAVCDFNMCFTFVVAGWEGSAHDSRIFNRAITDRNSNFPHPPPGKYYLVDAGYPMQRGYLKPYPDTRYHLQDFRRGSRPIQGNHEIFNQVHSSLRSVIERTFGVWKKKWAILRDMPNYSFKRQTLIVVATMALHNYIRRHPSRTDLDFDVCDGDDSYVYPEAHALTTRRNRNNIIAISNIDPEMVEGVGADEMTRLRNRIANQLQNARRYDMFDICIFLVFLITSNKSYTF
ncbi:hypothetical protein KSP39_PZI000735 [Platanthera zijinensis]|uniref:DDE Tnp4 domain-containing protein n=1 Tax=Platanthera zijinensis TaxID=2320716 RepID=A0AAP0C0D3_9ASPA